MNTDDSSDDAARRKMFTDVMEAWASVGIIGPAWTVEYDTGDGGYQITFTLFNTHGPSPRRYSFTEAEFSMYVLGLADWDPDAVGDAAVRLAYASREEDTTAWTSASP